MGTHIGTRCIGTLVFFLQLHTVLSSSTVMDPTENAEAVTVLSELAVEPVVVPCSTQSAWIRELAKATTSSTVMWWLDCYEQLLGRTSGLLNVPPHRLETIAAAVAAVVIAANGMAMGLNFNHGVKPLRTTVSSSGRGGASSAPSTTSAGRGRRNSKRRQLRAEAAGGDAHQPSSDDFPVYALVSAGVSQVQRRLPRNGLSDPLQVDLRDGVRSDDGGGGSIAGLITESDMDFVQHELAEAPCEVPHEGSGWSPLLYRTEGAVTYAVWKKPWKGGLNAYKSTTTIRGVSADELYSFHSDDELRVTWDDNIAEFSLLPTSARGTTQTDAFTELQFWRSAFPRPFASREYVFAKRQWTDPLQRACFSVSKGVDAEALEELEQLGAPMGYRVKDYLVATKISDVTSLTDQLPVTQLVQYSQEDNGVSASMINLTLKRGLWGFVQTQHHALCSYLVTAEGGAPPLRAIPPPRGGYRTRLQDQAPTSPSRWGDGSGEGGGVGQQPLAVTPLVLTTLNQPHVKQLLQQMQSSSRSIMYGARRAITSHMEEKRDDMSMLPGVRWVAMVGARATSTAATAATTAASLVIGATQHGNRFLRRVGPDGQPVRKRDVVRKWMNRELDALNLEKGKVQQRMYGVWQRIHLSEGPSPGGGSFGSPRSGAGAGGAPFRGAARWWQRMAQRRNARVENAKVRVGAMVDGLRHRRQQLRRHAGLVLMPLAFVLKGKAPIRDASFT